MAFSSQTNNNPNLQPSLRLSENTNLRRGPILTSTSILGSVEVNNNNNANANNSNFPQPQIAQNIDNVTSYVQQLLRNSGINPLRPEIVATTEFIPLLDDNNTEITNNDFTLTLGGYQLNVTGVVKLIEKQMTLQKITSKNIEKFLTVASGFNLNQLVSLCKTYLFDQEIPLADIETMKITIKERLSELDLGSNSGVESSGANNSQGSNSGQNTSTNLSGIISGQVLSSFSQTQAGQSAAYAISQPALDRAEYRTLKKITEFFEDPSAAPYADICLEYLAKEIFIEKSLLWIDGLLYLKKKLADSLDISNCDVANNLELSNNLIKHLTDRGGIAVSGDKPKISFSDYKTYYLSNVINSKNIEVAIAFNDNLNLELGDNAGAILKSLSDSGGTKKLLMSLKAFTTALIFENETIPLNFSNNEALSDPKKIPGFTNELERHKVMKKLVRGPDLYFTSNATVTFNNEDPFFDDADIIINWQGTAPKVNGLVEKHLSYCIADITYCGSHKSLTDLNMYKNLPLGDIPDFDFSQFVLGVEGDVDFPAFISKLVGFPNTNLNEIQLVKNYVLPGNIGPTGGATNSKGIARSIAKSIKYDQFNTDVVPLENDYYDFQSSNFSFETGQNFFVDSALLENDFNFRKLESYLSKYSSFVEDATEDYIKLHGNPGIVNSSNVCNYNSIFSKFKADIAQFLETNFVKNKPSKSLAYAFCILMKASEDKDFSNVLFRNVLFTSHLENHSKVGNKENLNIRSDNSEYSIREIESIKQLKRTVFYKTCDKLFDIDKEHYKGANFQDKHVDYKTGGDANLGSFPEGILGYDSGGLPVKKERIITDDLAHGLGADDTGADGGTNSEEGEFILAFNELQNIILKYCFEFEKNYIKDNLKSPLIKNAFQNLNYNFDFTSSNNNETVYDTKKILRYILGSVFENGEISFREGLYEFFDDNLPLPFFGYSDKFLRTNYLFRAYAFYRAFLKIIIGSLGCKATISEGDDGVFEGEPQRIFTLKYSKTQFAGVVDGLRSSAEYQNKKIKPNNNNSNFYKSSTFYNHGRRSTLRVLSKFDAAYNSSYLTGINHLLIMGTHLNALRKNAKAITNYLNPDSSDVSSEVSRQIINYYTQGSNQNASNEGNLVSMLSAEQIRSGYASYLKLFKGNSSNSIIPSNSLFQEEQVKNMIKYLTQPKYGYRKSESYGRKTVMHVGIPIGLINRLRRLSLRTAAGNLEAQRYEKSNMIIIYVYRQNILNPNEKVYPKTFIFDLSKFVIENPDFQNIDNKQIIDYVDNQNIDDLIKNHCVYKINEVKNLNQNDINSKFEKFVGAAFSVTDDEEGYSSKLKSEIFQNHLSDHYLKLYNRILSGVDVQEHVFQLSDQYNLDGQTVDQDKQDLFNGDLQTKTIKLFPDANTNSAIASEYLRLKNGAGNSLLFKSEQYMNATLQSKIFNRVFSIMINERDFVIHPDTLPDTANININLPIIVQQGLSTTPIESPEQLYESLPQFSADGKIQINGSIKPAVRQTYPILNNYANSIEKPDDTSQIYNYTVQVGLLPCLDEDLPEND